MQLFLTQLTIDKSPTPTILTGKVEVLIYILFLFLRSINIKILSTVYISMEGCFNEIFTKFDLIGVGGSYETSFY